MDRTACVNCPALPLQFMVRIRPRLEAMLQQVRVASLEDEVTHGVATAVTAREPFDVVLLPDRARLRKAAIAPPDAQAAVSALDGSHVRDGYDPAEDDPAHVESVLVKPQSWPQWIGDE